MNSPLDSQFLEAQRKHQRGDIKGALRIYDVLLRTQRKHSRARIYRALALQQLGRLRESREELLQASQDIENPGVIELMMLGLLFRTHRLVEQSEQAFRRGLDISPGHGPLLSNYAVLLMQLGRLKEAEETFLKAAERLPEDPAPQLNLARIYLLQKRYEEAEEILERVRDIDPGHPDYSVCIGILAKHDGDFERAYGYLIAAIQKMPSQRVAWQELRTIAVEFVQVQQINQAAMDLVRLNSTSAALLSAAVGVCRTNLAWDALDALERQLSSALEHGVDEPVTAPAVFDLLAAQISQKAHLQAAKNCWHLITLGQSRQKMASQPLGQRALRIGYLSSDLRAHAVGTLVANVIEQHSHEGFEWYAYNNGPDDGSSLRKRFRAAFDRWINVYNTTDSELVARIREDELDVLVDLNGITGGTRVQIFALGVAPVQVTWLGMPGSVGAGEAIDYQIADATMVDDVNIEGFDEKIVFLPQSYVPRDPLSDQESSSKTDRQTHQLPEDAVVYCSFNQPYKFSPQTLEAWARILTAVEGSVLWMMGRNKTIEERFCELLKSKGIDPERVIYAKQLPRPAHLERLKLADLMLDNWPYNAGTTCTDALLAGVPMLSLAGETFVSRVGTSILKSAGLTELTSLTIDDYVEKAIRIGTDQNYRQQLKQSLRERFVQSTIVDGRSMAKLLESAYRAMAERAASGLAPEHLHIQSDSSFVFSSEVQL